MLICRRNFGYCDLSVKGSGRRPFSLGSGTAAITAAAGAGAGAGGLGVCGGMNGGTKNDGNCCDDGPCGCPGS